MPRYPTVLFDLDGTLIDSVSLIVDSYHHTFAAHGLPPQDDGVFVRSMGTPLRVLLRRFADTPEAVDALIATYRAYNLAHHDARVRPYPGVVATVRALREAGVRLGVVTSKNRHGTLRGLSVAGLEEGFEVLVCADDVTNPKPHREPVDRAVALLGGEASSTLFVGDSVHDMAAGRFAAVATGAALWGPFSRGDLAEEAPDHWIPAPEAIVPLVLG